MPAAPTFRRPESVLVVVYTRYGEVLLLKRREPFEFWQSVTGSLHDNESAAAAALRELAEETGLDGRDRLQSTGVSREFEIDPRWRDRYAPGVTHNLEHEWRLPLDDVETLRLNPREHSDFEWLPLANALERVWSWTNREALQLLGSDLGMPADFNKPA